MAQAAGSALSLEELPTQLSICPAVKSEKGRTTLKQDCNTILSSLIIKKTEYCKRGVLFPFPLKPQGAFSSENPVIEVSQSKVQQELSK